MNPTPHKHAALIKQWADAPEWWDVYFFNTQRQNWQRASLSQYWDVNFSYELRKSAKHPDNIKPKKRLIDWSKMPQGTMTNCGMLLGFSPPHPVSRKVFPQCLRESFDSSSYNMEQLRLAKQTKFTHWEGGECPVPEGVVVEVECWNNDNARVCNRSSKPHIFQWAADWTRIIGYRITGLADGWTDNPEEAV